MSVKTIKLGRSFNVPQKYYVSDTYEELEGLGAIGDVALAPEYPEDDTLVLWIRDSDQWRKYHHGNNSTSGGSEPSGDYVTKAEVLELIGQVKLGVDNEAIVLNTDVGGN